MRRPKDVHHALALAEQVIGDDAPVATPPDGLGAHNRASVLRAQLPQPREAYGEGLGQGIVGVVAKPAHPPIGVGRWLGAARLSAKAAKRGDMFVADLPRGQRFGEAFTVELRISARPRHRPHVNDEIDAGFPKQIDEFGDRPGGMTDGEEGVRFGSSGIMAAGECCRTSEELWSKQTCFNRASGA